MATKMTKKDYFNAIRAIVIEHQELVDFIDHEIELLNRKSTSGSRKPSKTQVENEGLKTDILNTLMTQDTMLSILEIQKLTPSLAGAKNQKINALLIALRKEGKVMRSYVKKKAYFSIGDERETVEGE